MNFDLTKLTEKQMKKMNNLYASFLEENKRKEKKLIRKAKQITISDLQKRLFQTRNDMGDVYLDMDNKKYPSCFVDDDDFNIYSYSDRKVIAPFTWEDFIPCCDHLPEELLDELYENITGSVGGNYSRWDDIYKEQEMNKSSLLGYHTLENGLTFYGMYGTNDDYWSVFFILYLDENEKLAAYIPKSGNQYDEENQSAWSHESFDNDEDYEKKTEELIEKMKNGTYFDYEKIKVDILKNINLE